MRKLKIGIITEETDTQLVGFGNYTIQLTKHILQQDKKNEYYLIHRKPEQNEIYHMGAKEIIVPYNPRFPFSTIRNFITLPLRLRKYKLDIVHHMTITGPFLFKPLMNFKAVETIHEILALKYPKSFELPVRLVFKLLLPRIASNADHIFTTGRSSRDDIIREFKISPDKISIIYQGINPIFKPLDQKKCKEQIRKKYGISGSYLLFVSTLEGKKNVPTLLKAYKKLKENGIKHKLVLVGRKGYGYDEIEKTIRDLSLENEVAMPGYVPLEDLPLFYGGADVFVFPAYEGLNMTLLEAMKCGCPVVVSNGGASREAVRDAGIIVDIFDSDGYAKAIERVLNDAKLAESMRRKSINEAKRFTWQDAAKQTIDVYERLGA